MRGKRAGARLLALSAAAAALTPATASAVGPPPESSPVPVLDAQPFALPGGLSPTVGALTIGVPLPSSTQQSELLPRVVIENAEPRLVVRRVDPNAAAAVGEEVVVSDASSVPVGPDAAIAAGYVPGVPGPPTSAGQPSGDWLVAWVALDGPGVRLVGRRLDDDSRPVGAPFALSETTYATIDDVELALGGRERTALVAWSGVRVGDAGRAQVVTQGWTPEAGLVAPYATRVSAADGDATGSLALSHDAVAGSRHLVAWIGTDPAKVGHVDEQEVLGRLLAADGVPVGDVLRLSQVGVDGDVTARPADTAIGPNRYRPRGGAWTVAWSQAPAGDAAFRVLDADGRSVAAQTIGPGGASSGERIGGVAVSSFSNGGHGLVYDVGTTFGPRRVELQALQPDGVPTGAPLAVSPPGQDARLPLVVETAWVCGQLLVWRSGLGSADAFGRHLWEPGCQPPRPLDPVPRPAPRPTRPIRPRVAPRPPTYGPLRLRGIRLTSHRLRPGRTTRLRFRVTAPATVVVSVRPAPGARSARDGRRLPRLRPAAATLRRVLAREPQTVVVRIAARDGRGRALVPGRYRIVLKATSPQRARPLVARLPLRVVGR